MSAVRRLGRRTAVAALCVAVALPVLGGPAAADVRVFRDRSGDTGVGSDVTRVRVDHGGGSGRVRVATRVGDLSTDDVITLFIDVRRRDGGPEYVVRVQPNSAGPVLRAIERWRGRGAVVRCPRLRARADAFGPDRVAISVPRGCIRRPGRVRVAVRARFGYPNRVVVDWAPRKHRLFGPVPR